MTFLDENFAEVSAVALSAARSVKKRYPTSDTDDLTQMGLVWCVEHPRKLREYVDGEDHGKLFLALRNFMSKYARDERAERFGYTLEDEAFYSKRMLKGDGTNPGLLHYVFDKANWQKPPARDGGGRSKGDPAEGGTWLAIMCDVDRALNALSETDRKLLREHYKNGTTYEEMGDCWTQPPVSKTTISKYIDRAVGKMVDFLGGPKPREDAPEEDWEREREPVYVGTRRAISNAHARAITANHWTGSHHLRENL